MHQTRQHQLRLNVLEPTAARIIHMNDATSDDPPGVTGWTISGLTVLVAIVTAWLLGV
jgi:hypothetical protein